ncbi:MAG: class I SAM-dependent methyltransferase [Candidatus Eisenbacteria bacterium]|uniref:Class I SAM-dependent methyltransferase n=1 Tax=Eiseniibacteriota bacterium TaxID=2212470 RepID=A0A538TAF2_UNCEI|nr:MAG: class I SAM-dependent methyltransferase [Candidatus Eisenbacteria bacterium]
MRSPRTGRLSNDSANWDARWQRDRLTRGLQRRSLWDVLDEVKFGYLRPIIPRSGGSALEVGCGSARLLGMLARLGWKTTGIDFARSALDLAQDRFRAEALDSAWVRSDCRRLPFADGSYDLVTSTGLLEHFGDPTPVVSEMLRVLRSGGVFYSDIVPRKFSLLRALDRGGNGPGNNEIYERRFSRRSIETFVSSFTVLREVRVFPAGVFPPRQLFSKRIAFLHQNEYGINRAFAKVGARLDGSWVADWLGFYYFVSARKV